MKRLAIVVQRCHADVVGGSEALAWCYAQLLRDHYAVDILTSCALDYRSWDNALPAGRTEIDGIGMRRFATAYPRGRWFGDLHRRLLHTYAANAQADAAHRLPWRAAMAEQFIRAQGPWCPELIDTLEAEHADYAAVLFCTYLYPTSYFGMQVVPECKRILIPTVHDEPPAYLPVYAEAARRTAQIIWLTAAERALGQRLWQAGHGAVVGMPVDATEVSTRDAGDSDAAHPHLATRYFLYCGRIDESKGCRDLIAAFLSFRRDSRSDVRLLLTGSDHLGVDAYDGIEYLGHVSHASKSRLMAAAIAFVMPSPWESFSIVTLEAMAQGTPVIVNGACEVLAEHVTRCGAGWIYRGNAELIAHLHAAAAQAAQERVAAATAGQQYVAAHYTRHAVQQRLLAAVGASTDATP